MKALTRLLCPNTLSRTCTKSDVIMTCQSFTRKQCCCSGCMEVLAKFRLSRWLFFVDKLAWSWKSASFLSIVVNYGVQNTRNVILHNLPASYLQAEFEKWCLRKTGRKESWNVLIYCTKGSLVVGYVGSCLSVNTVYVQVRKYYAWQARLCWDLTYG